REQQPQVAQGYVGEGGCGVEAQPEAEVTGIEVDSRLHVIDHVPDVDHLFWAVHHISLDGYMRRRRADHGEQKSDARFQLGRHSLEGWVCVLVGAAWRGWIRNAPVDLLGPAAELRTYLSHSVAQRDHIVEALALESAQMLRRAACQL